MSNRHAEELLRTVTAVLKDVAVRYPELERELERDLDRLQLSLGPRGLRLFAVDLPNVGKHLDRCLANGQYVPAHLPFTRRVSKTVQIPAFLRGLYLLVFQENGCLRQNYDSEAVYFLRQVLYLGKKVKVSCSAKAVRQEVAAFWQTDCELPEPDGFWDDVDPAPEQIETTYQGFWKSSYYRSKLDSEDVSPHISHLLTMMDKVSELVCATLGSYSPDMWRFRHGPGAISEVTGPVDKYQWYHWPERLESVYPIADYGFHSYGAWIDWVRSGGDVAHDEPYSRLVAVPKTLEKPRLIAAEPSCHQWCQQNIWHYFGARSRVTWISRFVRFNDQTLNQKLCLRGSKDGSLATVDLSSASDRVTCHAVGQYFRSNPVLLRALQATRTRLVSQTLNKKVPTMMKLRKFSTMGNACTFPVESLLFLGIALSCTLYARRMEPTEDDIRELEGEVAVFGDDIIVPEASRELLTEFLEFLDFKVNTNKSFWDGTFRESCGVDAMGGEVVTPIYFSDVCSSTPESVASTVEISNRFYDRFMLHTAASLASTTPPGIPVVDDASGCLGFKQRTRDRLSSLKERWNDALQRAEVNVLALRGKVVKTPTNGDSGLFQYFTEAPDRFSNWSHGVAQRAALRLRRCWVPKGDLQDQPPVTGQGLGHVAD